MKITESKVKFMRKLRERNYTHRQIAQQIGCSKESVRLHLAKKGTARRKRLAGRSFAGRVDHISFTSNGAIRATTIEALVDAIRRQERERIKAKVLEAIK
jgi:orotate phosphoribosyltransferase-like protein